MQDAPDPRRHPRTVMATDTEWRRIRERAEAAGMPISRFVCQRAAGPERRPPPGVAPEAVLARLERIETAVLVLAEVECCSASPFDPPESKRIKVLPRRSASNLHA